MIEFIFLWYFTRHIGQIVFEKGYSSISYKIITILVWFGCQILGGFIGRFFGGFLVSYGLGLSLAVIGIVGLYLYIRNMNVYDEIQDFNKILVEDDNLSVFEQLSKYSPILVTLQKGDELLLDTKTELGDFYRVSLPDSKQVGYILTTSRFTNVTTNEDEDEL